MRVRRRAWHWKGHRRSAGARGRGGGRRRRGRRRAEGQLVGMEGHHCGRSGDSRRHRRGGRPHAEDVRPRAGHPHQQPGRGQSHAVRGRHRRDLGTVVSGESDGHGPREPRVDSQDGGQGLRRSRQHRFGSRQPEARSWITAPARQGCSISRRPWPRYADGPDQRSAARPIWSRMWTRGRHPRADHGALRSGEDARSTVPRGWQMPMGIGQPRRRARGGLPGLPPQVHHRRGPGIGGTIRG